jgi:3-phosphoglycerate kinase
MRKDIAAGFETLNTMMENNKAVVVFIHMGKQHKILC